MNRRSFLSACIATFTAPAIVRAASLMPLSIPYRYTLWADGIHDDAPALNAIEAGLPVRGHDGSGVVKGKRLLVGSTVFMRGGGPLRMTDCAINTLPSVYDKPLIHMACNSVPPENLFVSPLLPLTDYRSTLRVQAHDINAPYREIISATGSRPR